MNVAFVRERRLLIKKEDEEEVEREIMEKFSFGRT